MRLAVYADDCLGVTALEAKRGLRVRVADHPDVDLLTLMRQSRIESVLVVPLTGERAARAVIVAGRRNDRAGYAQVDLHMAEAFADQIALVLEVVASRAAQQRLAVLDDRERLAHDLHDHVIQRLYAAGLRLQTASATVDAPTTKQQLQEVMKEFDSSLDQLRNSIHKINDNGGDLGLRSSVCRVLEQVTPVTGFCPTVRFHGPVDALADIDLIEHIVAVIREATTNAGKHATATEINVDLTATHERVILLVTDNGSRLGTTTRRSGLRNMTRRAQRRGGVLTLTVPNCGGTQLLWTVPLQAPSTPR